MTWCFRCQNKRRCHMRHTCKSVSWTTCKPWFSFFSSLMFKNGAGRAEVLARLLQRSETQNHFGTRGWAFITGKTLENAIRSRDWTPDRFQKKRSPQIRVAHLENKITGTFVVTSLTGGGHFDHISYFEGIIMRVTFTTSWIFQGWIKNIIVILCIHVSSRTLFRVRSSIPLFE